jgi:hypothetical protein
LLGSTWLGRDAVNNSPAKQPRLEGLPDVTAEPARYGFHATLKAPFTLNAGMKRTELGDAVALMASQLDAVTIPKLELRTIDGFLALVPELQSGALSFLSMMCVCGLDSFRAEPSVEELARRRAAGLTARQEQLLSRWGYPYVLDESRFHMTLTRKLRDRERQTFMTAAQSHFAPVLGRPIEVDALTIFTETALGRNFVAGERFPLLQSAGVKRAS